MYTPEGVGIKMSTHGDKGWPRGAKILGVQAVRSEGGLRVEEEFVGIEKVQHRVERQTDPRQHLCRS